MIRNIWAAGRNYGDHAKELGNDVPTEPIIFLKAGSCAFFGQEIALPSWAQEVHHEIELALKFDANLEISHFGLALDLTERKLQNHLKSLFLSSNRRFRLITGELSELFLVLLKLLT